MMKMLEEYTSTKAKVDGNGLSYLTGKYKFSPYIGVTVSRGKGVFMAYLSLPTHMLPGDGASGGTFYLYEDESDLVCSYVFKQAADYIIENGLEAFMMTRGADTNRHWGKHIDIPNFDKPSVGDITIAKRAKREFDAEKARVTKARSIPKAKESDGEFRFIGTDKYQRVNGMWEKV